MKNVENYPIIAFETQQDWEMWLEEHQGEAKGVWLKIAKKATGLASMTHAEALDGALCYGWIDSQAASFDTQYWLQKFTPRAPRSPWSQVNCDKVSVLQAAGRMRAAGIKQVELAQADGRWEAAYERQRKASVPEDLQSELQKNQQAETAFNALNRTDRYAILLGLQKAKKAE